MKFVKFLLCVTVLFSSVNIVYAAEDSGVKEALAVVKQRVDTSEYDSFKSSYYKNDGEATTYTFNWSKEDDGYKGLYISIQNGIISNYQEYDYNNSDDVNAFSLSEAEALEIAKEFLKKINPDICENFEIEPGRNRYIQSDSFEIELYRIQSGIPVLNQSGYMSVSKRTKEVSDFYINYNDGVEFKSADKIISEGDAKEAYKKLIPPTLTYKFKRDYEKQEITAYLEYSPKDSGLAINAYDGKVYNLAYGGEIYYNRSMASKEEAAEDADGFTPAELEETERIAGLLSESEATKIAKDNAIIAIPEDFELEYSSLRRNWYSKDEYSYELGFEGEEDGYIYVRIDAKSGEILSFYNYTYDYDEKDKPNRKNEEKTAQKVFAGFAGDKASEFRMEENEYAGMVRFVRTYDGIDVENDYAYINFDNKDNITSYSLTYTKGVEFPSKNGVISSDKAAEIAFDEIGFGLKYAISDDGKTAEPVYCIGKGADNESFMINPFSGHLVDYSGDDVESDKKIEYSDIDGHYGKQIFLSLAEYGIGFDGGELKPDEAITQAEYFKLLNKAFGYETDIDGIYKRMINYGTISAEERADNSILTRENAAIFIIREMGAEEYAKLEEIYVAPFDDVTENKGYIAILKAKKIVNGDGSGNFYPQKSVTRGEALIMLYNYFAR